MTRLPETAVKGADTARRIVLVGAGHAHLHALRNASAITSRGFELVVVAPEDFWYSGLATGVLGGIYPPELDRIDIAALIADTGARLIRREMSGLDLDRRRVMLVDGTSIAFGVLSLNLGSVAPPIAGTSERIFPAKPVTRLMALRAALTDDFRKGRQPRVAVAGAGVTGCEIAAAVAELGRRHGATAGITVYASNFGLEDLPAAGKRRLIANLQKSGIDLCIGIPVASADANQLTLSDGTEAPFDYLVNATGLVPPPLTQTIGLPTAFDGALLVDDTLMSPGAAGIFAAGDCVTFASGALPRVGVYAIRQSPILVHNLMAHLNGKELRRFSPQKHYLSIMTLGAGTGFARRNGFWWQGRTAFWLKDWIDRRFVARHRQAREGDSEAAGLVSPNSSGG